MGAGRGSHTQLTSKALLAFEESCQTERPDAVLILGDVNSTLACSIVAKKLNIPVAALKRDCVAATKACRKKSIAWLLTVFRTGFLLAVLSNTGYEITDCFYKNYSELPNLGWKTKALKLMKT